MVFHLFLRLICCIVLEVSSQSVFGGELSDFWKEPVGEARTVGSMLRVRVVGSLEISRSWLEKKHEKVVNPIVKFRVWATSGDRLIVSEKAALASFRLIESKYPLPINTRHAIQRADYYPESLYYIRHPGSPVDFDNSVAIKLSVHQDDLSELERELILARKWEKGKKQEPLTVVFRILVRVWDKAKSDLIDVEFDVPVEFAIQDK